MKRIPGALRALVAAAAGAVLAPAADFTMKIGLPP